MSKNIILIAGAPTVGKSTLAKLLSKELGLPWISTDQIREIMWGCADKNKFEHLFNTHDDSAEEFYAKYSAKEVVQKEIDQAEEVWNGIKNFIEKDYTWKDGYIIEGVAILPHLVHRDFGSDSRVKLVVVSDRDEDRIREVVFKRGLWSGAKRYPDSVKEHEVEYVKLFNEWFEAEAQKYGYTVVAVKKQPDDIDSILNLIK